MVFLKLNNVGAEQSSYMKEGLGNLLIWRFQSIARVLIKL